MFSHSNTFALMGFFMCVWASNELRAAGASPAAFQTLRQWRWSTRRKRLLGNSCRRPRRHWASQGTAATPSSSPYTIDCPPTDADLLQSVVEKHVHHLHRFLHQKPLAAHTKEAFCQLQDDFLTPMRPEKIILDSGCGTARSSLLLGSKFPDALVIGVDRSLARLERNARVRSNNNNNNLNNDDDDDDDDDDDAKPKLVHQAADNVLLLRAELVDFWRCWVDSKWCAKTHQHYILYPNPYPKKARVGHRWYAHPSFPLLLMVSAQGALTKNDDMSERVQLVIRSNWEGYLTEFAQSIVHVADMATTMNEQQHNEDDKGRFERIQASAKLYQASAMQGPVLRPALINPEEAWTNFEEKYERAGENTYELILQNQAWDQDKEAPFCHGN